MTTYYEIPLAPKAQQFYITLSGVTYQVALTYRTHDLGGWFLDLYTVAGAPLALGVPLVTGVDLFEPYPDLYVTGTFRVVTDGDPDAVPTYGNLGSTAHLYFGATT